MCLYNGIMELKKITTRKDIELVKSFFYKLFVDETTYDLIHIRQSVSGKHNFKRLEYYLGYENNAVVGICGIYADRADECWLGWFGVLPEYRRKGFATAMLDLLTEKMKRYGYKICRIYTDAVTNKGAVCLYEKQGFKQDSVYIGNIITLSKSLDGVTTAAEWKGEPLAFVATQKYV